MKDSLKILMVDKFHFIKGGAERYFFELKEILEEHGHQVIPFSMHHPDNFKSEYSDYFVDHIEFNQSSFINKALNAPKIVGRVIYSKPARYKLERLLEEEKPDIAHLHMIDHQISPSILHSLKKYNIPVIQTVHQYKLVCPNYKLYNPSKGIVCNKCMDKKYFHPIIEKCHQNSQLSGLLLAMEMYIHKWMKIYDHVDIFHVPSDFMKMKLIEGGIYEPKVKKLFYSIKLKDYPYSPTSSDYFVYFGRLSKEKGINTLLTAMQNIQKSKLLIIGDGPQKDELMQFAKEHELSNVEFVGNLDKEQLKPTISKSKFVVVPSEWYDNSPLVIYESFSIGKPVIGSDLGGIPELVEHEKTGLIFKAGNVVQLSQQINRLLDEPEMCKKLGENARRKAEKEFEPDNHYRQIYALYKQLIPEQVEQNISPVESK